MKKKENRKYKSVTSCALKYMTTITKTKKKSKPTLSTILFTMKP